MRNLKEQIKKMKLHQNHHIKVNFLKGQILNQKQTQNPKILSQSQ